MKYKEQFLAILKQFEERAERNGSKYLSDGIILENVFFRPQLSPEGRARALKERNITISPEEIKKRLRYFFLSMPQNRELLKEEAAKLERLVQDILDGKVKDFAAFTAQKNESYNRLRSVSRFLTTSLYTLVMVGLLYSPKNRGIVTGEKGWLRGLSCVEARILVEKLVKTVLMPAGAVNVRDLQSVVAESLKEEESAEAPDNSQEAKLQSLEFQLAHLKSTLSYVEDSLEEMHHNIELRAQEAKDEAVADFFINMNSSRYGLLDKVMEVDQTLTRIRQDNIAIPPLLRPLTIIVRRMVEFIKTFGFEAIKPWGEVYETDVAGIELLDYLGEPFFDDTEKKKVKVISPGWQYKNIVISKPVVQEVTEEE